MPFVQLSREDAEHKQHEQIVYTGLLIGGLIGGAITAMLFRRYQRIIIENIQKYATTCA
jgi:hypothetical protein